MSSSKSTSSAGSSVPAPQREFCECGLPLLTITSNTPQNKKCRFRTCSKRREDRCRVWEWIDPPRREGCADTITNLISEVEKHAGTVEALTRPEVVLVALRDEAKARTRTLHATIED